MHGCVLPCCITTYYTQLVSSPLANMAEKQFRPWPAAAGGGGLFKS